MYFCIEYFFKYMYLHLFASSADCVIKNPIEFAGILAMLGLMQILGSELAPASSLLTSIASSSSLSLMKQSLEWSDYV